VEATISRVRQGTIPPVVAARCALWTFVIINAVIVEALFLTSGTGKNGVLTVAKFFGMHAALADAVRFAAFLAPLKNKRWFVYAKEPFAGPRAVLAYLSRYTHRVAISNSRLVKTDAKTVTFRVKNYRGDGVARYTTMTLDVAEFPSR